MENETDTLLLEAVARGDKKAMQTLYLRHHDTLFAFIVGRGCDVDTARDVVHDAMLDVWRTAAKFRGASSVRTWIFTIARNKFVDRVRGSTRLTYVEQVPEILDDAPDAETVIAASEDADRVQSCLKKLSDIQQTVLRLSFFDGLSYHEIAEIEDVPLGTIKTRVFHAKKMMLHCLGQPN